jgi:DNA-binding XRE family transcriptional regulator
MIPRELKIQRVRLGIPQYRLAAAIGVPQTTVCAWENGRRPMTVEQERLALEALRSLALASRPKGESDRVRS